MNNYTGMVISLVCNERVAKRIFYSKFQNFKRKRGDQLFKDILEHHKKRCDIDPEQWKRVAANCV